MLAITGNPEPELFADLDGGRVARARMREVAEASLRLTDGACNWSIVAFPNEGWAKTVFGEPDVERLWDAVATAVRLDEPDPVEAWREHIDEARPARGGAERAAFDALRYRGPGTDLTVGLLPDSIWHGGARRVERDRARREHADRGGLHRARRTPRRRHGARDLSAPDPGHDRPRPRGALRGRARGRGPCRRGRGADATHVATDDGAARLGEVALVDGDSRVGKTGIVFYDTLFDENAASHIALGTAIVKAVDGAAELSPEERHERGVNHSSIHTDFMIGSRELAIAASRKSGEEVPILRDGDWVSPSRQLPGPCPPTRSGRADSNCRPPRPKRGALPG